MADNCPLWRGGNCNFPPGSTSHCSWPSSDYDSCGVYKMAGVKARGGSMEDQLRAADAIPRGARVVGGQGRILSDDAIRGITDMLGARRDRTRDKKWWEFWK